MTGDELTAWRLRMGWNRRQAATALGLSKSGLEKNEGGFKPISPQTMLLARYIERHGPIDPVPELTPAERRTFGTWPRRAVA